MPITRHPSGRWLYQFNRVIPGAGRKRAAKLLPQGWTRKQADDYDRTETARLYALATGVSKPEPLIEDAVLLYLEQHAPGLKNFKDLSGALELCLPWYAGKPITALAEVAQKFNKAHTGKLAPATIKNRMSYLRAACRWAWKFHQMGEHDPAERMIMPTVRNERHEYLGRKQMLQIARLMHYPASRAVFRVAFYSGMRRGEVLRSQIVTSSGGPAFSLDDTKNGTRRIIPASNRVAHLTRGVWPPVVAKDTVTHHVKDAMRAVDLGHMRLHDSRHSAASEMINARVDLYTVGAVLGHKSAQSTKRYSHLATARLAEAVDKIGKKVA